MGSKEGRGPQPDIHLPPSTFTEPEFFFHPYLFKVSENRNLAWEKDDENRKRNIFQT
jgi:hypothetical protein